MSGDSKVLHIDDETNAIFDEIYPMIPDIETFYFAGGEALFQEEHYRILKRIIELEKFDARQQDCRIQGDRKSVV